MIVQDTALWWAAEHPSERQGFLYFFLLTCLWLLQEELWCSKRCVRRTDGKLGDVVRLQLEKDFYTEIKLFWQIIYYLSQTNQVGLRVINVYSEVLIKQI